MAAPWLLCFGLSCASWLLAGTSESVDVGCSAGAAQVTLELGRGVFLNCALEVADQPANVTWRKDGRRLQEEAHLQAFPNGSLYVRQVPKDPESAEESGGSSDGIYSCVRQSAFGTVTSRDVTVSLSSLWRFHQQPEPRTVWEHGLAHFECRVEGLPLPVITWEKDQESLPQDTRFIVFPSGILQIVDVQLSDAGTYRCAASNVARIRYSNGAALSVLEATTRPESENVAITAVPRNTTVVAGQSAVMECQASSQPPPMVSWIRQDGKPIATDVIVLGEANLLIAHARPHHSGIYVCRANRPRTRHFVTASAELRVLAPPLITHLLESVSRPPASTARFVCGAEGEPAPFISWLKNGEPMQPNGRVKTLSPGSLVITQIGPEDAGYYQCIAQNSLGVVCATARLSVIVREGLPSAPQSVVALPVSSTLIVVSWEMPEYNSEQIIGFSLHYQKAIGTDNIENQFAVNNDTLEFYVKDLQPSTSYVFYVVAYSQLGASRASTPIEVQTWEDVPAAAPPLSLSSTTPTDIRVTWLPLSAELSNGKIIKYLIEYCAVKEADQLSSVEVAWNETQVTLNSLHPNRAYNVRIAAGTIAGYGAPSDWVQHRTPEKGNKTHVPLAPTELKVWPRTDSLALSWQPPSNHAQISGYKLFYRAVSTEEAGGEHPSKGTEESWDAGPLKLKKKLKQYEILQLVPGHLYKVKLLAYNKHEDGYPAVWKGRTASPAVPVPDTQMPKGPPLPPSYVEAEPRSPTSVWLKWKKPDFSSVKIVNYTVRCNRWGQQNASLVSYYTSSIEDIVISGLTPYTKYEFAVQSHALGVDGPYSSAVERFTLPDRPSTAPLALQLNPISSYTVRVIWHPPMEPNGIIVEYIILYSPNSTQRDHMWSLLTKEGNISSADVQGLQSGTRYFFKMAAKTVVGAGPFSAVKDVTTLPAKSTEVLDIHSVTGIIVGVCLGLLCILFCMSASFRNSKHRDQTVGLDPQATGTPSYCPRGRQGTGAQDPTSDSHELESLMPPRSEEVGLPQTEMTELGSGGLPEETLLVKLKPTWNGSINPNWVNNITIYGDAKTPVSTANGMLPLHADVGQKLALVPVPLEAAKNEVRKAGHHPPVTRNRVEAEVIVHSDYSATERSCDHKRSRPGSVDLSMEGVEELGSCSSEEVPPQLLDFSIHGGKDTACHNERHEEALQMAEELPCMDQGTKNMEASTAHRLTNGILRNVEALGSKGTRETDHHRDAETMAPVGVRETDIHKGVETLNSQGMRETDIHKDVETLNSQGMRETDIHKGVETLNSQGMRETDIHKDVETFNSQGLRETDIHKGVETLNSQGLRETDIHKGVETLNSQGMRETDCHKDAETLNAMGVRETNFLRDTETPGSEGTRDADILKEGPGILRPDTHFIKPGRGMPRADTDFTMEDRGNSWADNQPLLCPDLQDTSLCNTSTSSNSTSASETACL